MTPEKPPETPGGQNVVKDIFDRKKADEVSSKKISSLFGGAAPARDTADGQAFGGFLPIGLDTGPSGIAFAKVGRSGSSSGPSGKLGLAAGMAAQLTAGKGSIRQFISENGLKGSAVLGLSAGEVKFRVLKLPPMPAAELDGAVTWAAAEALGIEADRMQGFLLDYAVLSGESPAAEKKVFVAAADREAVLDKMKEASDSGLNVIAVEPTPVSLYFALCSLDAGRNDPSKLTLLLNIGYGSGYITIGLGSDVYAVQDVAFSEEVVRGALSDDGSVAASKPSASSALEGLIVDIEHSFKAVSNLFPRPDSLALGRIAVTGPGASNKGIGPFLGKTFNIPAELFDPLGAGPKLAAAVGLAMRGVKDEAA